jgi:hypothetical protein
MKVIFLPKVRKYYENLIPLLYEKGYFGCLETSKCYVDDLIKNVETNLPTMHHREAPTYFDKYGKGMKDALFPKNKHTSWYVFFKKYRENGEDIFLVRYIGNNHVVSKHLEFNLYPPFNK